MGLVPHLDREAQSPHADLVDAQFPVVALTLLVVQLDQSRWRMGAVFQARPRRSIAQDKHLSPRFGGAPPRAAAQAG